MRKIDSVLSTSDRESMSKIDKSNDRKKLIYTCYVIFVLMIVYTFSFIDRQILSLLVEPMKSDLGISDTKMSLLQGLSFAIFYTAMGLPLGRIADSYSRRGLIAAGITVWSFMTAVCGAVSNYFYLFLARMGVGVGEAALSPAAYSLITDTVDKKHLAKAISVYSMGIYLGGGLALIVGGLVISWANSIDNITLPIVGEVFTWQVVFLAVGLPGLLLVPLIFTIREPRRKLKVSGSYDVVPFKNVIQYFKNNQKAVLLHNFGFALAALAGYGALAWVPTFLIRSHGLSGAETGLYYGLIVLIFGSGGVLSGGWLADRWYQYGCIDAKLRVGCIAAILGSIPTFVFPLVENLTHVLILLSLSTYLLNFMMGIGPAAIQELVPSNMRGQFSAFYLFIVNLVGLGIGPTAVALSTDYIFGNSDDINYSLSLVITLALLICSILLWLGLKPYRESVERLVD
ncbi:MAG: MFS transporter [Cellvibrionaceae bacterium]